ncbi:hypothetical protein ACJX0J_009194, partial [Zea mays]
FVGLMLSVWHYVGNPRTSHEFFLHMLAICVFLDCFFFPINLDNTAEGACPVSTSADVLLEAMLGPLIDR